MIRFKKSSDLDVFFVFRWLVLLSIILIAGYATEDISRISVIYVIAFIYFALNLFFRILKPEILKTELSLFVLFLFDIGVVSAVFYFTGSISSDYYIFYFLTIMMASISSGLGASIAITLASVGIYVWLVQQTGTLSLQDPVFLLKLVFLLLTAFISSLWNKIMKERVETVRESEKREKQDIQQFYREVISSINAGIAVIEDVEGEIFTRLINPKAQELTKGNKNIVPILLNCVKEYGNPGKECHLVKKENGRYWGINLAFFKSSEQKRKGAIVVFNDITERKKMEKEMQRSERINRLGKLTLQIAHDLRNPLGTVSGLAQILTMSIKNDKGKRYGREILNATKIINDLIGDMLDFSKDQELQIEVFDFITFTKEIVNNFKKTEKIKDKKIKIDIKYNKGNYEIVADKEKLRRVFNNLINNACDALTEKGQININISEKNGNIIAKIKDNGTGIPESQKDEIFEPFVTNKKNGTGLGLSIVQRIISSHKGKIFVDSKEGEGTEFTIELPKKGGENG
jgi:signal transduction histidine kinase